MISTEASFVVLSQSSKLTLSRHETKFLKAQFQSPCEVNLPRINKRASIISDVFIYLKALVNCGNPGTPSNGQKLGERYWTGQSVSFVCDSQYHLTGSATRMCLPSGNWSGIQPSCKDRWS